jgi:hypothetical protein
MIGLKQELLNVPIQISVHRAFLSLKSLNPRLANLSTPWTLIDWLLILET